MKSRLLWISLVLALLVSAAPGKQSLLVGRWRYSDAERTCILSFHNDGTFDGEVTDKSKMNWHFAGRWSLSGDTIHYDYTQSSLKSIHTGIKDVDKLVEVTGDHLVIIASDGTRRKYERIGKSG
jgi:hypothetical protein